MDFERIHKNVLSLLRMLAAKLGDNETTVITLHFELLNPSLTL